MLQEQYQVNKEKEYISTLVSQLERQGYDEIKSRIDDEHKPAEISVVKSKDKYVPDVTGKINANKHYFEVAVKTTEEEERKQLVSKWMVLSKIASMKGGMLKLYAPPGNYTFLQKMVNKHNIEAGVYKLSLN